MKADMVTGLHFIIIWCRICTSFNFGKRYFSGTILFLQHERFSFFMSVFSKAVFILQGKARLSQIFCALIGCL